MGKARELLLEAQAELRGSPGMLLDIPLGLGLTHSFFGEVDAAHGWLEQTVRAADAAGDHWRSAEGSFGLVRLALAAGDAAAAVLNARKAVEVSEHLSGGHEPPLASGFLALAQLLAASRGEGSEVEAEQRFDETVEELKRIEAFWRASLLLILRAELELSRGRFTDALRFAQAGEPLRADEGVIKLVHCRAIQAEACLALGQLDDAQRYWALACQGELSARMRTRMATVKAALDRGSVTPRAHTDLQTSGR
jgi:tetratricopeptide (TPR) repeat protein